MRNFGIGVLLLLAAAAGCSGTGGEVAPKPEAARPDDDGWIDLFDGRSLEGWTASENPETFQVFDGAIVTAGPRAHLFYTGPVADHDFKDFEFRAEVMTEPGSNSGMYFHTAFQAEGWPAKGYEAQINNSHPDPRKTGSLYAIQDVMEAPAADGEWFTQQVNVSGKRIVILVNGETLVDYTEPEDPERAEDMAERLLSSGTVALQGHDPESRVHFRKIQVRLPR